MKRRLRLLQTWPLSTRTDRLAGPFRDLWSGRSALVGADGSAPEEAVSSGTTSPKAVIRLWFRVAAAFAPTMSIMKLTDSGLACHMGLGVTDGISARSFELCEAAPTGGRRVVWADVGRVTAWVQGGGGVSVRP